MDFDPRDYDRRDRDDDRVYGCWGEDPRERDDRERDLDPRERDPRLTRVAQRTEVRRP